MEVVILKKLFIAIVLLLTSLIYVLVTITQNTVWLDNISVDAQNPVSFHWDSIAINTGFIKNSPDSIYYIWMIPVYVLVLISLILTAVAFRRKKKNKYPV